MKRTLALISSMLIGILYSACMVQAQQAIPPLTEENSFPFVLPWDDSKTGTATDVSFLNVKPAGVNGPIVVKRNYFVEEKTGSRVRFFGVNATTRAAFPSRADADKIAARMAKLGINIVRFHHINNGWDTDGGTLWKKGRTFIEIDPAQLDKMDYFIAALKKNGIYTNINLQTAREYIPELGLPASVRDVPGGNKQVDKVNRKMIQLQKEFARQLLDRKNPHTGLKYAADPAIMVLEINNENSLVGAPWEAPGTGPAKWPEPFKGEVVALWNAWLKKTYGTDAKLAEAWPTVDKLDGKSLITQQSAWTHENQSNGNVEFKELPTPGANDRAKGFQAKVVSNSGPNWHVQAHLGGLDLENGKPYTLEFRAKSDHKASIGVNTMLGKPDWRNVGLQTGVTLEPGWKDFSFSFRVNNTEPNASRVSFVLGDARGTVELQDVRLLPGEKKIGLLPGESLAKGNIALPAPDTSPRFRDYIRFLADTEKAYSEEMRAFLRDELGFKKTNIIDTQITWGGLTGLYREQKMEFADNHEYWNHPDFLGQAWDPKNYRVNRRALVNELNKSGGTLASLARSRVIGKPYSVSEYNHPAPSDFQSEMMPLYAAFAAFQDWDAIYVFDWSATGTGIKNDMLEGYFDSARNPAKTAFFPATALIFRNIGVPVAPRTYVMQVDEIPWEPHFTAGAAWSQAKEPPRWLEQALGIRKGTSGKTEMIRAENYLIPPLRTVNLGAGNVFITEMEKVKVASGFVGGEKIVMTDATFEFPKFGVNFAALTVTATDDKPLPESKRALLTLVGRVENRNMGWNKERNSVSDQWGEGPVRAEVVPCQVVLKANGPRDVYALDPTGARKLKIETRYSSDLLSFTIGLDAKSVWFEIVKP